MLRKDLSLIPIGLASLTMPACSTASDRPDIPGCRVMECIAMKGNQKAWEGLVVTPLEVIEDSRCPIEAECVWEGRILLKVQLEMGHESITVALDSGEPMRINGGFLSFAEIAPDMSSAWAPIRQEDYRFAFKFAPDIMKDPAA